MQITDVKTTLLTGPWTNDPSLKDVRKVKSAAFIEIFTDKNLVGVGETYAGYFIPEVVPEIVNFFKPILIGRDVSNISKLWHDMYYCGNFWCRVGLGTQVLTGIEAALWDLKGKLNQAPVYELLGGRRHDKLLAYASGAASSYPKAEFAKKIEHYLSIGFKAFKTGAGCFEKGKGWYIPTNPMEAAEFEGDKMEFITQKFGKDVIILMDGHMSNSPAGTWELPAAQAVLKAIEPYNLFFFEEPLPYTNVKGYVELRRKTTIPIAGGESLTASCEWESFVEKDAFDIGQPDAAMVGGMQEFMKIAAMFESRNHKIATHSWGSGGSLMQNIHCGFACANTVILEIAPSPSGLHTEIAGDAFSMEDGMVLPPEVPGLGLVLTDEIKNKYPFVPGTGEFNSVPGKILST